MHHSSIVAQRRTFCVSPIDGNCRAADAKFTAAQRMIMLCVIALVGQHPHGPQIACGLSHCRRKIRRVLARPQPYNGSRDELGRGVKNGGQFRPSRMRRVAAVTFALVMQRDMSSLQPRCIDGRCVAGVVYNQPTVSSTMATSRKKSLESPFSRSFCSTCHNVE